MSDKQTIWTFTSDGTSIKIPEKFGADAANVCAKIYARVDKVRQTMVADGLTTNSPLSNLPSGTDLGEQFTSAGCVAYAILNAICDILTNFGNAFIWSENTYKAADDDASAAFLKIRNAATARTEVPNPHKYAAPTADQLAEAQDRNPIDPSKLPSFRINMDDAYKRIEQLRENQTNLGTTKTEFGLSQWEGQLRTLAGFRDGANSPKATAWGKMAAALSGAMDDFYINLDYAIRSWNSNGKTPALRAVSSLSTSAGQHSPLIEDMNKVSTRLHKAVADIGSAVTLIRSKLGDYDSKSSKLLEVIRLHDEITSSVGGTISFLGLNPDTVYDALLGSYWPDTNSYLLLQGMQKDRKDAIDAFDNGYCPAVYNASAKFPALTAPANPLTAVGDGSGDGSGHSGSSSDGNGYGTGSYGTGSGFGSGFGAGTTLRTAAANPSATNSSASNTDTPSGDSSAATDLLNQAQQGMQALSTAAQSVAGATKDPAQDSSPEQPPTDQAAVEAAAADTALASQLGAAAADTGALTSASRLGRASTELAGPRYSKLFPRASVTAVAAKEAEEAVAARAGAATSTAGTPGMPGTAARGAGTGPEKSHRQRENLLSGQHLDEALGQPVIVGVPVVED
jgi:hypothetical protein